MLQQRRDRRAAATTIRRRRPTAAQAGLIVRPTFETYLPRTLTPVIASYETIINTNYTSLERPDLRLSVGMFSFYIGQKLEG
jgi:hypothetical protein